MPNRPAESGVLLIRLRRDQIHATLQPEVFEASCIKEVLQQHSEIISSALFGTGGIHATDDAIGIT